MIDAVNQLKAIHREVGTKPIEGGEGVGVLMRRTYHTSIEDVWDAVTDPERLRRWFLPISGDLRVGGTFQLEGNAGGEILECDRPRLLRVTFGGPTSVVELRLAEEGDEQTTLELEHTVPIEMAGSVAGALFVGPGWDGAFVALGLYFDGDIADDPVAAADSPEAHELMRQSIVVWTEAVEAAGTASPDQIAVGVEMAKAQFTPDGGGTAG